MHRLQNMSMRQNSDDLIARAVARAELGLKPQFYRLALAHKYCDEDESKCLVVRLADT